MKIIDSKLQGNVLQEFTADYLEKHKELIKYVKEETEKQLRLYNVSQQRELLAFRKWQKDNWKDVYLYSDEFMITEFKKAN